jgi:hypothetical protein
MKRAREWRSSQGRQSAAAYDQCGDGVKPEHIAEYAPEAVETGGYDYSAAVWVLLHVRQNWGVPSSARPSPPHRQVSVTPTGGCRDGLS